MSRPKISTRIIALVEALALQSLFIAAPARGGSRSQEQPRQPLGALSAVGEVYVNDSPAPAEGTIFSGDTLRTGANGTAAVTPSGKGSLKIATRSQLVFAGTPQYLAELKSGTAIMSSASGAAGVNLRAGNFVVAAVTEGEQSTSSVESAPDGSFVVNCLEGSVGVLPLDGANGIFLQVGQAANISPQGELSAAKQPEAPSPAPAQPNPPPAGVTKAKKSNTGFIILLLAGGVAAGAGAALGGHGGSGTPVSPSVP
jgi:ferric-dicitrate binding protein FerR (iron transport regulator)